MIVKHSLLHQKRKAGEGYLTTGSGGEYLGPEKGIWGGESFISRNFIVYTVHLI